MTRVTTERVLIVCLFSIIGSIQVWNTHRIDNLIAAMNERTLLRWRMDNMQGWIDESQKRHDRWSINNHLARFEFPSTDFR